LEQLLVARIRYLSHLVTGRPSISGTDEPKKIGVGWTNFAAVAMEAKKGGFNQFLDSFHETLQEYPP
jgi:hypothetical protein